MTPLPLVTVICLCHNHQPFVRFALESVLAQTYKRIELIIVDDGSSDGSKEEILQFISEKGKYLFLNNPEPKGNCKAFNEAFEQSKGSYIIDLAADDMLLPKRIEEGINDFLNTSQNTGIQFTDAFIADENGTIRNTFYHRDQAGNITNPPASGDIFRKILQSYFICPPTMMIKSSVLKELSGYDENLSYEDFDFWVRSSRNWDYLFNPAPLVKKREIKNSLGKKQNQWSNKHVHSTYLVCQKALQLCKYPDEFKTLLWRCGYEIKQCFKTGNLSLIIKYLQLIRKCFRYRLLSSPANMDK
ncbi:MAG: glycosyltransferase family A protein [Cyclobacteriaceae bacterium]